MHYPYLEYNQIGEQMINENLTNFKNEYIKNLAIKLLSSLDKIEELTEYNFTCLKQDFEGYKTKYMMSHREEEYTWEIDNEFDILRTIYFNEASSKVKKSSIFNNLKLTMSLFGR